jgi:SAM-dependent methyltransferase
LQQCLQGYCIITGISIINWEIVMILKLDENRPSKVTHLATFSDATVYPAKPSGRPLASMEAYSGAQAALERAWALVATSHPTAAAKAYVEAHWVRYAWLLASLPPLKPGMRVLEVGASIVASVLKQAGAEVSVAYHELEPEWASRHRDEGIQGVAVELLRDPLPYAANSFDLILCDQVLEHLPLAADFLICQMLHLLKPDGVLVVSVPNFAVWEKRIQLLKGANPQDPMDSAYLYYAHHREPVMKELLEMLASCGGIATLARWTEFALPRSPWRQWLWAIRCLARGRLGSLMRRLYPATRDYIVIHCTKNEKAVFPEEGRLPPLIRSREFMRKNGF